MDLSLDNIINVQVSQAGKGVGQFNTSNIGLFTTEPFQPSFGSAGYAIYLDPIAVGDDFGTASITFQLANEIFSQQPNILANSGYLAILPMIVEVQTVTFDITPTGGTFVLTFGAENSNPINWNDTAAQIQTNIQTTMPSFAKATVTGTIDNVTGLTITFYGLQGPQSLLTITSNLLTPATVVTVTQATAGETFGAAVARTENLVQYFGTFTTNVMAQAEILAAAAIVQALQDKIAIIGQRDSATIAPGGTIDLLRTGSFTQSRGLYKGDPADIDTLLYIAGYAGRGLSTNFAGSLTTQTMQLKDLIGIQPDPTMTQTLENQAQNSGADTYVSFQGVPKVLTSGANDFFDNVYNLLSFVNAIKIAGFNAIAQTSTKIPQTENGMDILKSAFVQVCEQYVSNGYLAPGKWTSAVTFGNQEAFYQNISQRGYYIYSTPISQQSPSDRVQRKAPLVQIAIKLAGAIQKISVIINVNP